MPQTALEELYSTVVNLTDGERSFGYLGQHGRRLAAGEQYTVPGNIVDQIAANRRKFQALERDLDDGVVAIVKTPAVFLYDETEDQTKVLTLDNETLGSADASYGGYSSSL